MNNYKFEELSIGSSESFSVTVTEGMMDEFRGITGDLNPLHKDDAFAERRGFKGKAAFGLLTASFLSTLAGMYLPGEDSLIQKVEVHFMKPVYPGDSLEIRGTVTELNEAFRVMALKVEIRNQDGLKVLRGTMNIGLTK